MKSVIIAPRFSLRRIALIDWIVLFLLLFRMSASCQSQIQTFPIGKSSVERPVLIYTPMGPVTNSVLDATLSKAIVTDGVNFDARIWVFRLAEQHERFATVKNGFTPIPILLGDVLWVLQLGDHYGMEIIPALPVFRSKKNHAEIGQDSVRMDPKRFDIGTGQGNLSLPRNPGNFYLSDFIVENHLNNPLLANPIDSLPLQNIVVDKTRIAFDVVFLKNAPIRMIFDHQFDLVKLERNGKELEFDRKVWKGIHEKWRQSISDWRKLNRGEK